MFTKDEFEEPRCPVCGDKDYIGVAGPKRFCLKCGHEGPEATGHSNERY